MAAQNILASIFGYRKKPFLYTTIGRLAPIGKWTDVANILGVNFSGFIAWWLWWTIYLLRLPQFEKKVLVALDWTLDVLFSKDPVQFRTVRPPPCRRRKKNRKASQSRLVGAHLITVS